MTRTWYDSKGKPQHEKNEDDISYSLQFIFTYHLNKNGQVILEEVKDHKGVLHSTTTTQYNVNGQMMRRIFFDAKGKSTLSHIFQYE